MKKGKIIVIDGMDGTGKETQSKLLYEKLKEKSDKVMICDLPNYESDSSYFVRKYLREGYTRDIDLPLLHDSYYAIDRAITYFEKVKEKYEDGYTIIFDRYTISNIIFRLHKTENKIAYIDSVLTLEQTFLKLPKPDLTILMISKPEVSLGLLNSRYEGTSEDKDLNENIEIQTNALKNIMYLMDIGVDKRLGQVVCIKLHDKDNNIYSIEKIHEEIMKIVNSI